MMIRAAVVVLVLWSSPAMAQPSLGVLDNCNRTESPISTNWSGPVYSSETTLRCDGTAFAKNESGATTGSGYYTAATYGPNAECSITITVSSNDRAAYCWIHVANPNSGTLTGYYVVLLKQAATDTIRIFRVDNATDVLVAGATSQEVADGDAFGVTNVGNVVKSWYKPAAGSWAEVNSYTDVTTSYWQSAGYLGTGIEATTIRLDNFSGGTIAAPVTTPGQRLMGSVKASTGEYVMSRDGVLETNTIPLEWME